MQALQDSIKANGLLQPIGVDKDRRLVFGGRRLAACKALGLVTIEVKVVDCDALIAENDENEVRKAFTVSERVAIAAAVAERLKGRRLANLKQHRSGNISGSDEVGDTRDLAAAKAGLGSGKTLEAAQVVLAKGTPSKGTPGPFPGRVIRAAPSDCCATFPRGGCVVGPKQAAACAVVMNTGSIPLGSRPIASVRHHGCQVG